ncbi:lysine-specific demethylase 4C isoform X2 [Strongylocentrotus purpuratus]|uniref:[histone H3]-trimethyl-L-lysine(9) demethylase n=1 Tax=Strongylocentrotus purpuratus TaxID=7668 RepID=A0A7M7PHD3_STRPU|nr:lysine-specific demethylase 4C isoform X2 [Strongylocentrotus purpuratus]
MSLTASSQNVPRIMVFRPTLEEMNDFSGYISYMESQGANRAGVAKVIPPKEFVPRKNYDDLDLIIPAPIQQEVMGHQGLYTQYNIQKKAMTVKEFAKLANSAKYQTPPHFGYEDLERKYWKNITYNPPIYGADISGSVYDKGVDTWNINRLNTVLDIIEEEQGVKIEGVNTAYLYFGMWKTTFAWHTEDLDLYSINYLHYGAPKSWYAIPPEHGKRLERLATGFFPGNFKICSNFLRHKMSIIAPHILKKYSIPFNKITQEQGEFMVTFPFGYHSGFNHGYNCAESTNFASLRWINYGKRASCCTCQKDSVKISMEPFVRVFQPDRYEAWKAGKDSLYIEEVDNPTGHGSSMRNMKEPPMLPFTATSDELPRRHPVHKKDGRRTNSPNALPKKKKKKIKEPDILVDGVTLDALKKKYKKLKKKAELGKGDAKTSSKDTDASDSSLKLKKKKTKKVKDKDGVSKKRKSTSSGEGESPTKKKKTDSKSKLSGDGTNKKKTVGHLVIVPDAEKRKKQNSSPKKLKDITKVAKGGKKPRGRPKKMSVKGSGDAPTSSANGADVKPRVEDGVSEGEEEEDNRGGEYSETSRWVMFDHRYSAVLKPQGKPSSSKNTYKHKHQPRPSREEEGRRQMVRMRKGKAFTMKETRAMKDWARSLNGLWVTQPTNFMMEMVHNASMADQKPGCCVCRIFFHDKLGIYDEDDSGKTVLAGSSQDYRKFVLTPEDCFAATQENSNPSCHNPLIDDEACSPILSCSSCNMAVHASCYGHSPREDDKPWLCQRCQEEDWSAVCCLCNLRGGALRHTTSGKWAHIMCAMAIPEIRFVNVKERSPIDCSNISEARLKLKCFFCRSFIKYSPKFGSCIQCSVGKCAISFHVTCANVAGVIMEPGVWPCAVFATCIRHPVNVKDWTRIRKMKKIQTGDQVIAKHKNNRYYNSVVKGEKAQLFCHVVFKEDQSFCDNLYPEDIESHNIAADGVPEVGSDVEVRWVDALLYPGTFINSYSTKMYEVLFEDGSVITVKKEDIYKEGEPMPKKVRARLSEATEVRYIGFSDLAELSNQDKTTHKEESERLGAGTSALGSPSKTSFQSGNQQRTETTHATESINSNGSSWNTMFAPSTSNSASGGVKEAMDSANARLKEHEEDTDSVAVTTLALQFNDSSSTAPTLQGAVLIAPGVTVKTEADPQAIQGSSSGEGHVYFPNDASLKLDTVSFRPGETAPNGRFFLQ